jgi:hypothetical protein
MKCNGYLTNFNASSCGNSPLWIGSNFVWDRVSCTVKVASPTV